MFAVRHLIETLLNPFFIAMFIFCVVLILFYKRRNQQIVRLGFLITFLILISLSTGWLPQLLTKQLENQYPVVINPNPNVSWVVVLSGGQSSAENLPANMLLYSASLKRLIEGIRLYRQLPEAKLLLSGGSSDGEPAEAKRLAEVAQFLGIPANTITLEAASINTAAQAKLIKDLLGKAPFYLVTSAIHMPRSMYLFKQQGLNPIAAPTDFTLYWDNESRRKTWLPNPQNLFYFTVAWHEVLGLLWAKGHHLV